MFNEISNIVIFVSVYFRYLRYSLHIENPRASTAVIGAFHVAIQFPALGCVPSCGHVEQLGGSAYCPTPPPAGEHLSIKKNIFILRNVELVHRPSPLPDLCDYHADLLNCHVNSTCMGLKRLKGKKNPYPCMEKSSEYIHMHSIYECLSHNNLISLNVPSVKQLNKCGLFLAVVHVQVSIVCYFR